MQVTLEYVLEYGTSQETFCPLLRMLLEGKKQKNSLMVLLDAELVLILFQAFRKPYITPAKCQYGFYLLADVNFPNYSFTVMYHHYCSNMKCFLLGCNIAGHVTPTVVSMGYSSKWGVSGRWRNICPAFQSCTFMKIMNRIKLGDFFMGLDSYC